MRKRKLLTLAALLLAAVAILVLYCDSAVKSSAAGRLYNDEARIPYRKVGLLLGTARQLQNGYRNLYYDYRIEAAARLWKAGKVRYLVLSGDNSRHDYNEPEMMRADLIRSGVDSTCIYLDYAGFRTFDSMVRLRAIFGQDSVTVISQPFHNERALYIARREGIAAIGFNARDVSTRYGFRVQAREKLARVKVFADYWLRKKPKYLGTPVGLPS
ncbi:MAG: vancomycin high temperature exclusion protein [Proteobacteria bacterium]|nr:MAG: vancomycin high temperature exclusion protein [Pseudomonadota bacterium]